jgi:hypothetical protein
MRSALRHIFHRRDILERRMNSFSGRNPFTVINIRPQYRTAMRNRLKDIRVNATSFA